MTVCSVWEYDPDCCDLPDDTEQELIDKWQAVSSEILFAASGRRYGLCEVTVRPCLRRCGGGSGLPTPYKDGEGEWRNFATCGCVGDCSCVELCEIVLDGPVDSVTEVLIDGEVLEADAYRLDLVGGQYRLLRTDGGCWPSCSDFTKECDEVGAFCVTYDKGIPLDELAIAANSELTCELVKSCIPGCVCRLPKNVAAVTRSGVTLTFDTAKTWLRMLPNVAIFLDTVNPHELSSPSRVWSPDLPAERTTVTVEGS
jgi:hypothetical protein